jgi:hypothetical protein
MDCDWDPERRRGTVEMTAYVRRAGGRYTRHETTLHEYAWSDRALARALVAAGFAEVWRRPWSAWRDAARPERVLWCGRVVGTGPVDARALRALGFARVRAATASRRSRPSARPTSPK